MVITLQRFDHRRESWHGNAYRPFEPTRNGSFKILKIKDGGRYDNAAGLTSIFDRWRFFSSVCIADSFSVGDRRRRYWSEQRTWPRCCTACREVTTSWRYRRPLARRQVRWPRRPVQPPPPPSSAPGSTATPGRSLAPRPSTSLPTDSGTTPGHIATRLSRSEFSTYRLRPSLCSRTMLQN